MGFFDLFRRNKKSKLGISSEQFKKGRVKLTRSVPILPSLRVSPELRSLSSKFDVIAEVDQRNLPPIPHPIYRVCRTPASSTIALTSPPTPGRETYSVKVLPRPQKQPSCASNVTELPLPVRPDPNRTSKTSTTLQRLYDDPSIMSLLALYDDEGRPTSHLFRDGRARGSEADVSSLKTVSSDLEHVEVIEESFCVGENTTTTAEIEMQSTKHRIRRKGSTLRRLLTGRESAFSGNQSGDIVDWMEKQLSEYEEHDTSGIPPSNPNSPVSISTVLDHPSIHEEAPSCDEMSSNFFTPSNASKQLSYNEDSPSPAYSKRASQLFQFLIKKKRNSSSGDIKPTSSVLTVDEVVRSSLEETFVAVDEGAGLLEAFPGPPTHTRTAQNRDSYRLFHLPGRPKNRERNYEQLSPVTEADYPPTPVDAGSPEEPASDISLPPDIQPIRLVSRKPPSYDIYNDETIPSFMKPEIAGISSTSLGGGPTFQRGRKALVSIPPDLSASPARTSPRSMLAVPFMDENDENNPFILHSANFHGRPSRRKSIAMGLRGLSNWKQI